MQSLRENFEDDVLSDEQPNDELIRHGLVETSHPEPDRR
jgi:hypothetical protein